MRHVSARIPAFAGLVCAAAVLGTAWSADAPDPSASLPRPPFRMRALDDAKTRASIPFTYDPAAPECAPGVPTILGDTFDPASVDEIATSPNGVVIAWPTLIGEAGVPGATRDIVIFREGVSRRDRVSDAAGDNDHPSLATDRFGFRMAWRGSDAARGASVGNIWLRSHTSKDPPASGGTDGTGGTGGTGTGTTGGPPYEDVTTVQVTKLTAAMKDADGNPLSAYDPSLAARVRVREVGSGVKVRERDARIAFVSTARFDDDPQTADLAGIPQLWMWREQDAKFVALTDIRDPGYDVNRPALAPSGARIAFECNADLTPGAVDPKDPTRAGNSGGVRQIYLWTAGRGIRQLTWSDRDCFAPRFARGARALVFCSSGELISGGNPERNFEIFGWTETRDAARSLQQLTRTAAGQNVLPRPARGTREFAFWSTSSPPSPSDRFGVGAAQCGPLPYRARGAQVVRLGGLTDAQNLERALTEIVPDQPENPVVTGPPCPGTTGRKVMFATNHPFLNEHLADDDLDGANGGKNDDGSDKPDDRKIDASLFVFHVARVLLR